MLACLTLALPQKNNFGSRIDALMSIQTKPERPKVT